MIRRTISRRHLLSGAISGPIAALPGSPTSIAAQAQAVALDALSVLDFIPATLHAGIRAHTGTADLAGYVQTGIVSVIAAGGGTLFFPPGTYRVDDSLTIPDARRCNLVGEGKATSIISRGNTNGPIIRLLNASSTSARRNNGSYWHWRGLGLRFDPRASESSNDAIGVSFETGSGERSAGYVNFIWDDIEINGAHVAVSNAWNPSDPPNVWGWRWDSVVIADFASRALYLTNGNYGGFPNCCIGNLYLQGRQGVTYRAAPFYCDAVDGWHVACLEYNIGRFDLDGVISIQGRAFHVATMRLESIAFTRRHLQSIVWSQGAFVTLGNISIAACTAEGDVSAFVLRLGTGTLGSIFSIQTTNISGPGKLASATETDANSLVYLGQTSPSAGAWIGGGAGYCAPRMEIGQDGVRAFGKKVIGARDTGWTATTGTANKEAYSTYAGQKLGDRFSAAQAQATDDAVKDASQRLKAIEDALRSHGLIS